VSTDNAVEPTTVESAAVESEVEVDVPALFEQAVNVATATIAIAKIVFLIFFFVLIININFYSFGT
jgi:predicted neutral ceramidase superfamily lipid hydrolase